MVDKMHIAILQENVFLEEKLILLVTKKNLYIELVKVIKQRSTRIFSCEQLQCP